MRYTTVKSQVHILGEIWMPRAVCAQTKTLSDYDIGNIRGIAGLGTRGPITRDRVEYWLMLNSGDFSHVIDFRAELEDVPERGQTLVFDWADPDNELRYADCFSDELRYEDD